MVALEALLRLPDSRFAVSDLMDLLDVPALRERFRIDEADLPVLRRWIEDSGIRWGLDARQRESLGLMAGLEQNTWRFGLRRMLLGYAVASLQMYRFAAVEIVPASGLLLPAWSIAVANERSFYDSLYVALAVTAKTELITADERLVNALGSRFPVRWLGAF